MKVDKLYSDYPNYIHTKNSKCLNCRRMHCELRIVNNKPTCPDCYLTVLNVKSFNDNKINEKVTTNKIENINPTITKEKNISSLRIFGIVLASILILSALIIAIVLGLDASGIITL